MRKLIVLGLSLLLGFSIYILSTPQAKAQTPPFINQNCPVMGFPNERGLWDCTGKQVATCMLDQTCVGIDNKVYTRTELGVGPVIPLPTDTQIAQLPQNTPQTVYVPVYVPEHPFNDQPVGTVDTPSSTPVIEPLAFIQTPKLIWKSGGLSYITWETNNTSTLVMSPVMPDATGWTTQNEYLTFQSCGRYRLSRELNSTCTIKVKDSQGSTAEATITVFGNSVDLP